MILQRLPIASSFSYPKVEDSKFLGTVFNSKVVIISLSYSDTAVKKIKKREKQLMHYFGVGSIPITLGGAYTLSLSSGMTPSTATSCKPTQGHLYVRAPVWNCKDVCRRRDS